MKKFTKIIAKIIYYAVGFVIAFLVYSVLMLGLLLLVGIVVYIAKELFFFSYL